MNPIFADTGTRRYRVVFMTLEEYFAGAVDDRGAPINTSRMRGVAWSLWHETLEPFDGWGCGDCVAYGLAPTRRAAIGRAKTAVGL